MRLFSRLRRPDRADHELAPVVISTIPGTRIPITEGWRIRIDTEVAAIYRARSMTADAIAELPVESRTGQVATARQPRIVEQPNDDQSTDEFVHETMRACMDNGEAYWLLNDHDDFGRPTSMRVAKHHEVIAQWDQSQTKREYVPELGGAPYRLLGESIVPTLAVVAIDRGPNDLTGNGPMQSARIRGIIAEQRYSQRFFEDSAHPGGIITSPAKLSNAEARDLQQQWIDSMLDSRAPKVLSAGYEWESTGFSPNDAKWVETHMAGILDVAELFGVPPEILGANTSGSSLTYQNLSDVWEGWWRSTLKPTYVRRIAGTWSRLIPRGQHVSMNANLLVRAAPKDRFDTYQTGIESGVLTVEEARELEGLPARAGATSMIPVREGT